MRILPYMFSAYRHGIIEIIPEFEGAEQGRSPADGNVVAT